MFYKKSKFKPLYKQFTALRENVQNRIKVLNFKKKKWENFKKSYRKKFKFKFKPKDQIQYVVSQYPSKWFSYKKRYKNMLITNKKIRLLYGALPQKLIKKQIWKILNKNYKNSINQFLNAFENRLDVTLYKAGFSCSIRNAKQLILHNKIFVNGKSIRICSYLLKVGDLITIDLKFFNFIKLNVKKSSIWPIPSKHLFINYKTLQILFGNSQNINDSLNFTYHLNLEKTFTSYYQN